MTETKIVALPGPAQIRRWPGSDSETVEKKRVTRPGLERWLKFVLDPGCERAAGRTPTGARPNGIRLSDGASLPSQETQLNRQRLDGMKRTA